MELRGQNIRTEVHLDGEVIMSATLNVDGTLTPQINLDTREYQGRKSPVFKNTWGGMELSLNAEPETSDWTQLVELAIAKAQQDSDALQKLIHVFCEVDYGDGDLTTVMLADATMHSTSISLPGRTDVSQFAATFSSSDFDKI